MTQENNDLLQKLRMHTDFGHSAQDEAFIRQVSLICSRPHAPVTQAAGKAKTTLPFADAMSLYRFANNDHISLQQLRTIRAKTTLDGVAHGSELLLIHDITLLDFSSHNSKRDRRHIGDHRGKGYEYKVCLAMDLEKESVLGVIHDTLLSADGPDDQDRMDYDYEPLFRDFDDQEKRRLRENHRHQMAVHIHGTAELLSPYRTIDVGDREFDDVFIINSSKKMNRDFVIRSMANRNVQISDSYDWVPGDAKTNHQSGLPLRPGYNCVNFTRLVQDVPLTPYKELPLDGRERLTDEKHAKRFVKLSIGAFSFHMYRNVKRNKKYHRPPCPLDVNCVVIRECDPPPGVKPLLWVLITSLPIDTPEQIERIGRIYELRWRIEVFFRLLKSGYGINKSRLNNATKIARYAVILTIAATCAMQLKSSIGLSQSGFLSDKEYEEIKKALLSPMDKTIDVKIRIYAFIAKTGGWLARRRDPIGPTVIMRGLLQFMTMIDAYCHFQSLLEELKERPDVMKEIFGFSIDDL